LIGAKAAIINNERGRYQTIQCLVGLQR
jgi:hypothetical protein